MKVRDIVKPTEESGYILASGAWRYEVAIVVSLKPFILVSIEADMIWKLTVNKEDFKVIGEASSKVLKKCMKRIN